MYVFIYLVRVMIKNVQSYKNKSKKPTFFCDKYPFSKAIFLLRAEIEEDHTNQNQQQTRRLILHITLTEDQCTTQE